MARRYKGPQFKGNGHFLVYSFEGKHRFRLTYRLDIQKHTDELNAWKPGHTLVLAFPRTPNVPKLYQQICIMFGLDPTAHIPKGWRNGAEPRPDPDGTSDLVDLNTKDMEFLVNMALQLQEKNPDEY